MFRRAHLVLWLAALASAALAASSAGQGPPGGSPPGLDKAIAAKQKHAERLLDKPGVAGVAVGLNPAGKPVIRIFKEKDDVEDLPTTSRRPGRDDHHRRHRAARPSAHRPLSATRPDRHLGRARRRSDRHARRPRHERDEHLRPVEQPRLAGVNTANIGDPIIRQVTQMAAAIQLTGSARWPRTRRSTSAAAPTRWTRRSP